MQLYRSVLMLARRGSCFQVAGECAGLSCKMAGFAPVQLSAQHVAHKNHRDMTGAYQDFSFRLHVTAEWFSSICLLWSCNSFGRKEKKCLSLQSTEQLLGALPLPCLLLYPYRAGEGKAGDALCAERSISHLTGKSNNSLKVPILTPHQCQVGCKIHMDISKALGADFLS